jgi:molybdenum cofactor cytidylyltransferase
MKFGKVLIDGAEGAILAHSLQTRAGIIKKGRPLNAADVEKLKVAGFAEVMAARLGDDDVGEDDAAAVVARAIAGAGMRVAQPFTGRCNLYAESAGIAMLDADTLNAINRLDEALTIATVPPFERVEAGQMLATVKVIPFAVAKTTVAKAVAMGVGGLVTVAPFAAKRAGLVLTKLSNTKASVLDKRRRVMADRLASLGGLLADTMTVPHDTKPVAAAIAALRDKGLDPIIVFAASAIVDRNDVIPSAVVAAGGEVTHLGMPVDPGNLMMMGRLGTADVIGAPSCAGSPKLNGFDWVLERRMAGLPAGRAEIQAMGVGGLLKEIPTRPQPRDAPDDSARREKRIGCIVLAAGRSSRMGPRNKLLEQLGGRMIIRATVENALASRARPVVVVTGHQGDTVAAALAGLDVLVVHNREFATGMAGSLKAGLAALPEGLDGAIIALGDMPEVAPAHLDRLIAAFEPKEGRSIIVPVHEGRRGNPVLWDAALFAEMDGVLGDTGARQVLARHPESIVELDLGTPSVLIDLDTPEALTEARRRSEAKD